MKTWRHCIFVGIFAFIFALIACNKDNIIVEDKTKSEKRVDVIIRSSDDGIIYSRDLPHEDTVTLSSNSYKILHCIVTIIDPSKNAGGVARVPALATCTWYKNGEEVKAIHFSRAIVIVNGTVDIPDNWSDYVIYVEAGDKIKVQDFDGDEFFSWSTTSPETTIVIQ